MGQDRHKKLLLPDRGITRRDFVNASLAGAGAALLTQCAPAKNAAPAGAFADSWTGFGGVGDYGTANGNPKLVMDAAHAAIRDALFEDSARYEDDSESYDILIVGAGFAGLSAAYELQRTHGDSKTCLILENHPIFGGNARENELVVDGHRLLGPQASNDIFVPEEQHGFVYEYWRDLNMPFEFEFAKPEGFDSETVVVAKDNYQPMYWDEKTASIGWFFQNDQTRNTGEIVKDAFHDDLARAPLDDNEKRQLASFRFGFNEQNLFATHGAGFETEEAWLDSMSYGAFIENVLGLGDSAKRMADPLIAVGDMGAGADAISALAARGLALPGAGTFSGFSPFEGAKVFSFPGGNSAFARHFVKALIPGAYRKNDFASVAGGPLNFGALDKPGQPFRMRLNSLAMHVKKSADGVEIYYHREGKMHRVKAKAVVLAIEGHAARRIVADLPESIATAYGHFRHGPILTANVALTNWRFLEKLGISGARWSEGFGFYGNVRWPMHFGDIKPPFHPDKPIVWTFYVPFTYPGLDAAASGSMGRAEMLSKSFADYELEIRQQMHLMFGRAGFDAQKDIAGIVLNRWGHAYISPQPGFYTGIDGAARAPSDYIREGDGPIQFAHSELTGQQNWIAAAAEGRRAIKAALAEV